MTAQGSPDPLKSDFENPPTLHSRACGGTGMNGNISQEGITLDLEWMYRIGIGGLHNFDASLLTPRSLRSGSCS